MRFEPCKIEHDIWSRPCGEHHYEHLTVCADDLLITYDYPKGTIEVLTNEHSFKTKVTQPTSHHLGCDFCHDDDITLNFAHKKHVETMI